MSRGRGKAWSVVVGVLALVLAGCSNAPARERTDVAILIDVESPTTARIVVRSNGGFILNRIDPIGAPSTVSTTTPPVTPQDQAKALHDLAVAFGQLGGPAAKGAEWSTRPSTATLTAIANVLVHDATVRHVDKHADGVAALVEFSTLRDARTFVPAAVVRAAQQGGLNKDATVWVAACINRSRGQWQDLSDQINHVRGCASWVPDPSASSSAVLRPSHDPDPTTVPTVVLVVLLIAITVVCVVGSRQTRRWPYAVISAVLVVGVLAATVRLFAVATDAGHLHDVFATSVESHTRSVAFAVGNTATGLAIVSCVAIAWMATRRRRRSSAAST